MKTVTYGWLIHKNPIPSLAYCSNKYQYYYCPTDENNPFADGKMVKIKKDYVIKQNIKRYGEEKY